MGMDENMMPAPFLFERMIRAVTLTAFYQLTEAPFHHSLQYQTDR